MQLPLQAGQGWMTVAPGKTARMLATASSWLSSRSAITAGLRSAYVILDEFLDCLGSDFLLLPGAHGAARAVALGWCVVAASGTSAGQVLQVFVGPWRLKMILGICGTSGMLDIVNFR